MRKIRGLFLIVRLGSAGLAVKGIVMNAKKLKVDEDGVLHGPFVRTRYNYDMDYASKRSGLECLDATRAQQQFKEECDINTIVENFGLTGTLPLQNKVPINAEFIDVMDYQESLNKLMEADAAFMKMPAKIRSEFQNDAGKFVDFVSDPKNIEKCREWGLAMPKAKEPEAMRVHVVNEEKKAEKAPSGPGT